MRGALVLWILSAGAVAALDRSDLEQQGYRAVECLFTERGVIDTPCERAWRESRWFLNDATGIAYREFEDGRLRRGHLFLDRRWEKRSEARQIVMPMEEAVASHLTIFDGGGAIYALQYWANPGSGQFFRGQCKTTLEES